TAYGRYAQGIGVNPLEILPLTTDATSGALAYAGTRCRVERAGSHEQLVTTEGSARQHGRGIAQAITVAELAALNQPGDVVAPAAATESGLRDVGGPTTAPAEPQHGEDAGHAIPGVPSFKPL